MRIAAALAAIALMAVAGLPSGAAAPLHRYRVDVAESLDRLKVRACFDGPAPAYLMAGTSGAAAYVEQLSFPGGSPGSMPLADRIDLGNLAGGACIDYSVRLDAVRGGVQSGGPESRWVGRDLLTSIGDWLWRPPPESGEIEISFALPPGVKVSTPWRPVAGKEGQSAYLPGSTPAEWPGVVAFGRFSVRDIAAGGATLHMAMLDGPPAAEQARIERWIASAARNVATLRGRFPVDSLQVIVSPIARGKGPVPWAYVARGGGPAVHLFINPAHSDAEFSRDWSATHEMAHLFLPYVGPRDVWLTEGVPTYLQNLLMARGGAIEEREAWSRMIVGLQRGAKVGAGLTLAEASGRAGIGGIYQRVYWGGAGLMLEADLRLREQTGGTQSLDTALEGIARCCLGQERRWPAVELLEQMDRATGTTVFADLARERLDVPEFPDFQSQLVRAGVTVSGGEVVLDDSAPLAGERRAMARPAP